MTGTTTGVQSCLPVICGAFGGIASHAASSVASSIFTAFAQWIISGASWLVAHAVSDLLVETQVHLDTVWFASRERAMLGVAALVVAPLLGAATIGAVLRQDVRRLVRIYAVGLPVAVLTATTAVLLTQWALALVDQLCAEITSKGAYTPYEDLGGTVGHHGVPVLIQTIVGSFIVGAAIALWMESVLRATVVYLAVFFLPLALAGFVWPSTAQITKRFVEVLVAVIGSKFVIVATLTLGAAVVEQRGAGIDAAVTGTAILLLAAFAPFAVLRLVPLVEVAAVAHLEGMSRRPARTAMAAGSSATSIGGRAGRLAFATMGSGGGDGGVGPDPVGPPDVQEHPGEWSLAAATARLATSAPTAGSTSEPAPTEGGGSWRSPGRGGPAGAGPDRGGGSGGGPGGASGGVAPTGSGGVAPAPRTVPDGVPVPVLPPPRGEGPGPLPDGWDDDA